MKLIKTLLSPLMILSFMFSAQSYAQAETPHNFNIEAIERYGADDTVGIKLQCDNKTLTLLNRRASPLYKVAQKLERSDYYYEVTDGQTGCALFKLMDLDLSFHHAGYLAQKSYELSLIKDGNEQRARQTIVGATTVGIGLSYMLKGIASRAVAPLGTVLAAKNYYDISQIEFNKIDIHQSAADQIIVADAKYYYTLNYFQKIRKQNPKLYQRLVDAYDYLYRSELIEKEEELDPLSYRSEAEYREAQRSEPERKRKSKRLFLALYPSLMILK